MSFYTIPFGFSLFRNFRVNIFYFRNHFVWLRITYEGSLPEMRIWFILLIKSELKWCIHLSRSLFLYCLFNVTINDISVIYVTAHTCADGMKKLYLPSDSQRHIYFVGFFNVPVQAPTRDQPFYTIIPTTAPLVAFYDTLGIRRTYSRHNSQGPHGGSGREDNWAGTFNLMATSHIHECEFPQ